MAPTDEELDWELLGSQRGPQLPLFGIRFDTLRNPRNQQAMERLVLESVDWVNVVARAPDGCVVMVEQYRFGIGGVTLETPGGMVDSGETPLRAAQRELTEETGFSGGSWHYLGAVQPNPAVHDNLCHHFLARDVQATGAPQPGAGEALRVRLLDPTDVVRLARDGVIRHALALSVLGRVFPLWPDPDLVPPDDGASRF